MKPLLLLISCCIVLASCNAGARSAFKNSKEVPDGFGSRDVTILVLKKPSEGRYNRLLEKYFSKYYTGDYKLVSYQELYSDEYADTKKYKYLFGEDTDEASIYTTISLFYLKDRTDDGIYKSKHGGRYPKAMRSYIKLLEKVGKKNKG